MKLVVGVVVYKREHLIHQWLRAWRVADKLDAKLCVIHNYDGDAPDLNQQENILKFKPDHYIPRKNVGQDILAFRDFIQEYSGKDWTHLAWFTDDNLPMRKDFLSAYVNRLNMPSIAMVGNYWVEPSFYPHSPIPIYPHIRNTSIMLIKDAADEILFPEDIKSKNDAYMFEWGDPEHNLTKQIKDQGWNVDLVHGNFNKLWTECNDYIWDAHELSPRCHDIRRRKDLWTEFEKQFS